MSNNKQTAVEWLINEIDMQYPHINIRWKEQMIDRAKEMEKQQIIDTYKKAQVLMVMDSSKQAEQYYNEEYGK